MATVYEHRDEPEKAPPAANDLPDGYRPSPEEPFMNPRQLQYFREKLLAWKDAIHREAAPDRGWRVRLLRGDGRADQPGPARSAADRDDDC